MKDVWKVQSIPYAEVLDGNRALARPFLIGDLAFRRFVGCLSDIYEVLSERCGLSSRISQWLIRSALTNANSRLLESFISVTLHLAAPYL